MDKKYFGFLIALSVIFGGFINTGYCSEGDGHKEHGATQLGASAGDVKITSWKQLPSENGDLLVSFELDFTRASYELYRLRFVSAASYLPFQQIDQSVLLKKGQTPVVVKVATRRQLLTGQFEAGINFIVNTYINNDDKHSSTEEVLDHRFVPLNSFWNPFSNGFDKPMDEGDRDAFIGYLYLLIDDFSRHDSDLIRSTLTKFVEKYPNYAPTYLEMARVEMKSKLRSSRSDDPAWKTSERFIRTALEINPNYANAYVLLGYVLAYQKRFVDAESALIRAEKIGTDNYWLYTNWGDLYLLQGQDDKAVEKYKMVADKVKAVGRNIRAQNMAFQQLLSLLLKLNRHDDAAKYYERYAGQADDPCVSANFYLYLVKYTDRIADAAKASNISVLARCGDTPKMAAALANYRLYLQQMNKVEYRRKAAALHADDIDLLMESLASRKLDGVAKFLLSSHSDEGDLFYERLFERIAEEKEVSYFFGLVNLGLSINRTFSDEKITLLMAAVAQGHVDVVRFLLAHGANKQIQSLHGQTAWDWAQYRRDPEVIKLLSSNLL